MTESERVLRVIEPSLKHAGAIRSKKLGIYLAHAMGAFKRAECPMGNLFVDLMRAAEPAADGAFANGGSLRADLPGGELTFGQMHQAMPFDNQLAVVPMSGKELKRMIAINVAQNEHGILSLSGFRARVSCADGKIQVALFREDGAPVADNERLSIVTNDFMALGGDGLLASAGIDIGAAEIDSEKKVYDVLVEGLRSHGGWDPEDRTIFDPAAPRIQLPGGTFPVVCRETASSANH